MSDTLVVYWGSDEWDAPRSPFEMLDVEDGSDYFGLNDWKINLLIPNDLSEEEASQMFSTDLGKALIYIKNMENPDKIEQLSTDERFRILNTDTVLLLNEVMNTNYPIQRKETTTDMCNAIQKIEERAAIKATIDTLRDVKFSEPDIKIKIMTKYNLSEEDACAYMSGQKG